MNERIHFFIKNIPLTLNSRKGWCWLCVRGELETGTDCYILTTSSSDHSRTSFAFWLGWSTVGHWGPQALSLQADSHTGILSPNWLQLRKELPKPSVAPDFMIVFCPPASAAPPLIYTGVSLDWRLGRGSIYIYIYIRKDLLTNRL